MNQDTSINIRLPNITDGTDREQLRQIRSYLYQMAKQLNYALGQVSGNQTPEAVKEEAAAAVAAAMEGSKGPKGTFNSIKSLIIKSADIVDAYYEQINRRLEGLYVAQSDFGTYSERTSQEISENSEGINRLFTNVQTVSATLSGVQGSVDALDSGISGIQGNVDSLGTKISGVQTEVGGLEEAVSGVRRDVDGLQDELGELRTAIIKASAYMKSGLLYYGEDGTPVYGLEIGQTNTVDGVEVFDKFARFSADRLSFYDRNDTEVAYISDYKLFITNAQITGTLTVGRYELDTSDGLGFGWAGD